jgi:hypothetical protein
MSNTSSYGLRELAHKYYQGELSYDSYRQERTQLLDRLTLRDDEEISEPITRPMPEKSDASSASGFRWLRSLLILIVLLTSIVAIIWLMKPGWLALYQARMSYGIEVTMINNTQLVL